MIQPMRVTHRQPVPPLTREQIDWAQNVFHTWLSIRRQAKQEPTISNTATFTKSCLLARLLMGEEPLCDPPPTFAAAPWYELIEDGFAMFDPAFASPTRFGPQGVADDREHWLIGGDAAWFQIWAGVNRVILDRLHPWTSQPMNERWILSLPTPIASAQDPDDGLYRLQRIEGALLERLRLQEIPETALVAPVGGMTGCSLCGVGPEDECTMDCPSRLSGKDE